jgi:hypothetical protein
MKDTECVLPLPRHPKEIQERITAVVAQINTELLKSCGQKSDSVLTFRRTHIVLTLNKM